MNPYRKTALAALMFGAAFATTLAAPVQATPVMDWRAPDLLLMAPDLRTALKLNPNQATLWSQTESRTRALLRERQSRQEKAQAQALPALQGKNVELRDLAVALDAEEGAVALENRQLREWWLTVNDALDEPQRQTVAVFLSEQLQRKPEGPAAARTAPPRHEDGGEGRGGHKGGPGGGINLGIGGR